MPNPTDSASPPIFTPAPETDLTTHKIDVEGGHQLVHHLPGVGAFPGLVEMAVPTKPIVAAIEVLSCVVGPERVVATVRVKLDKYKCVASCKGDADGAVVDMLIAHGCQGQASVLAELREGQRFYIPVTTMPSREQLQRLLREPGAVGWEAAFALTGISSDPWVEEHRQGALAKCAKFISEQDYQICCVARDVDGFSLWRADGDVTIEGRVEFYVDPRRWVKNPPGFSGWCHDVIVKGIEHTLGLASDEGQQVLRDIETLVTKMAAARRARG